MVFGLDPSETAENVHLGAYYKNEGRPEPPLSIPEYNRNSGVLVYVDAVYAKTQSPAPGLTLKYLSNLPASPLNVSASAASSFLVAMLGHFSE